MRILLTIQMQESQRPIDMQIIESAVLTGNTVLDSNNNHIIFPTKSHAELSSCSLMCTPGEYKFYADTNNADLHVLARNIQFTMAERQTGH